MRVLLVTAAAVSLLVSVVLSQPSLAPSSVDAVGTEFTIFFEENAARVPNLTFDVQLFITTHSDSTVGVKVRMPLDSKANPEQTVTVKKGEVTEVNFPQTVAHIGSGISNKGIHILAEKDIIVYGVNPQRYSSEGFIAIPNHLLGTDYYAIGMPAEDQHSQCGVVAVEDGETEVTVTLPNEPTLEVKYAGKTYGANDVITATISKYQTFQLQHRNKKRGVGSGDMSGAHIVCSKRCAAFSGNSRTSVEGDSRDLLVEQLPPVATWGKEFAVPTTPERTDRPDVLKIVCQQDGTNVMVDGKPSSCDAGSALQMKIATSSAHYVVATKPIMAAHIVMSQNGADAKIQADPAMTLIIPEEQYAQTYTIATATWSGAKEDGNEYKNFLSVMIRRDRIDSVVIDGDNVNTKYPNVTWNDVPGTAIGGRSALVTAYFRIDSGTHTITTLQEDATFMCIVYGAGDRESYAYMGGMRLEVINPQCTQVLQATPGDGKDNDCDARIDEELCDATDDDSDGSVDEDCVVKNAVVPEGDQTVFVGDTAVLKWTIYATDFANSQGLKLYKKQPTAEEVLLAEGSDSLTPKELFENTGRYSIKVSDSVRRGQLDVIKVELTITGSNTKDPGNYRLAYMAQHETVDGSNKLSVKQREQQYEIVAKDLTSGTAQSAKSTQPKPRNMYFQEGKKYSLTFLSFGGKHLDDLPYRLFYNDAEATADFEVIGAKENYVTGQVTGMQDVKEVYELRDAEWLADMSYNKKTLASKNAESKTVVNAILNVESLTRPSITCEFKLYKDKESGRVVCKITDVTVDIDTIYWNFDGDMEVVSGSGPNGPYTATYWVDNADPTTYTAVLRGIKPDQWAANSNTRVFTITFKQNNGFTLSADIPVTRNVFPVIEVVRPTLLCGFKMNDDGQTGRIICDISSVHVNIDTIKWKFDGNTEVISGAGRNGPYTATHQVDGSSSTNYAAVLNGISPDQWKDVTATRVFTINVTQTDGFSLTADTGLSLDVFPGLQASSKITCNANMNGNKVIITCHNEGGLTEVTGIKWRANTGGDNTNVDGGQTVGVYKARNLRNLSSSPYKYVGSLVVNRQINGDEMYEVIFLRGNKEEKATITVTGTVYEQGVVTGEFDIKPKEVKLTAMVTGGKPPASSFTWTLPDGTTLTPGSTSGVYTASEGTTAGETSTFYLTIDGGLNTNEQQVVFNASAPGSWWGSYTYNLPATSTPPSDIPTVSCGLRTQNLNIGEEVELVCTVTPNSNTIDNLVYENIMINGNKRNITLGTTSDIFRYEQKTNADGTISASLFFTFVEDIIDLSNYNFYTIYGNNYIITNINLVSVFSTILNQSPTKSIIGVETGSMTLQCQVQAGDAVNFGNLVWIRKSLGPNKLEQTVVENQLVQSPFNETGRFIETHKVTSDSSLESQLKITNLQRGDAAEYYCVWGSNRVGSFQVDVIGVAFLVNDKLYDRTLTPLTEGQNYRLAFEFESIKSLPYLLRYGGIDYTPETHTTSTREGSRYDTFAQENVKTTVTIITNPSFTPDTRVIQTLYNDENGDPRLINTYVLTVRPGTDDQLVGVPTSFVSISIGDSVFGKNEIVRTSHGQTTLTVIVKAPKCDQQFMIHIGNRDRTSTFERTAEQKEGHCLITYTRTMFRPTNHGGKVIKTIYISNHGNEILSENNIELVGESSTVAPATPTHSTTEQTITSKTTKEAATKAVSTVEARASAIASTTSKTSGPTATSAPATVTEPTKELSVPTTKAASTTQAPFTGGKTPATEEPTQPNEAVDYCKIDSVKCDYGCQSVGQSYQCTCPEGLLLSNNGWSCVDKNECLSNPCGVNEKCINTYGSYTCLPACECQCCGEGEGSSRKRRSVSDESKSDANKYETISVIHSSAVTEVAILAWLFVLTAFTSVTFFITITSRRSQQNKLEANF